MVTEKKKKTKTPEEIAFNKKWGRIAKLYSNTNLLSRNIGKAPACNTNHSKKEVNITTVPKKKK